MNFMNFQAVADPDAVADQAAAAPDRLAAKPLAPSAKAHIEEARGRIEVQHRTIETLHAVLTGLAGGPEPVEIGPAGSAGRCSARPTHARPQEPVSWWPLAAPLPEHPLAAMTGNALPALVDARVVGYDVIGLRGEDLETAIAGIAAQQDRDRDFRPVFLTDQTDFRPFTRRGFAFEFLQRFAAYVDPDTRAIHAERRRAIARKWAIETIVDVVPADDAARAHPHRAAIASHNAGMSQACHRDRFRWMAETLRIALAGERYAVAEPLAEHLFELFCSVPRETQLEVARALCRKMIAFGEIEKLKLFLFKNIHRLRDDDQLFTWFTAFCLDQKEFATELARLPSGKANLFYIHKRMAVAGDRIFPVLMSLEKGMDADSNLLLANHFATRHDADLYRMFLNRAIGPDVVQVRKADFGAGNVLSTLRFEDPARMVKRGPLVSVIMSAFNAGATIDYAARSILDQSYANLELLICDDGSNDDTAAWMAEIGKDPRVRVFRSIARQGTYNIRNALLDEARGELITYQDSDDLAFPDRIARQVEDLTAHRAAAVVGRWYRILQDGQIVFSSDHNASRLAVVSLMARRHLFDEYGPYRSARFGADTEFFEKLRTSLGPNAVRIMTEPLIFGLAAADSLTRSQGMEASEDGYRAPARRLYAAAAASLRFGNSDETDVAETLDRAGILMPAAGISELKASSR